ncbi:MAG: helix-turn-helix transcriptional regulator [Methylotenera sp.]|uniref:helix-turn-helix domain-containing protein n=1 Tax=Methylotenera sp. TaxID=2051956 RepID=UPI0024871CAA|nr:helix-turn-helix transcriptional regulator [Methylotenera sp.]MDI1308404.1 helix-turn-helix transcriptional regulator [Methylotenera sp.]
MQQTPLLIVTLKKALRANNVTYKILADKLGMSESSIKRIFSEESLSLQRLEQICALINMDLSDLVQMMNRDKPRISELTEEQEQVATADMRLLGVAFLVVNGWAFNNILAHYPIKPADLVHYLLVLDKLRVIDLEPNNRIRLLISPNFSWRKNGPIQRALSQTVQKDFMEGDIESSGGQQQFVSGMLSATSRDEISKHLERLCLLFNELKHQDQRLPLSLRTGFSMATTLRPWREGLLASMIKKPECQ